MYSCGGCGLVAAWRVGLTALCLDFTCSSGICVFVTLLVWVLSVFCGWFVFSSWFWWLWVRVLLGWVRWFVLLRCLMLAVLVFSRWFWWFGWFDCGVIVFPGLVSLLWGWYNITPGLGLA